MTRPTFSSTRMPAKCGGDRAGGSRSVEDGSPHAPAMTCHPVPCGERRVAEFGFTVSYSVLSLRRRGRRFALNILISDKFLSYLTPQILATRPMNLERNLERNPVSGLRSRPGCSRLCTLARLASCLSSAVRSRAG